MIEALARRGFAVEVLSGTRIGLPHDIDPAEWLSARGYVFQRMGGASGPADGARAPMGEPVRFVLESNDVPVTLHHGTTTRTHASDDVERAGFLHLFKGTLDRFRPDVLINFGGDRLAHEIRSMARGRGIVVVFALHNCYYPTAEPFATADAIIVPSHFAADHYRSRLGLGVTVLPNLIDHDRVRAVTSRPNYVTFVNPCVGKGVYVFARIADELGRRRRDITLLVVEAGGTEKTLASCGLDLRRHGNVNLLANTPDPRRFWSVTRLCLMPSLWDESQGLVAAEAMINGIPVIASDRGALPETLGTSGVALPLPARLMPDTHALPTPEEVAPWVAAILRACDDRDWYATHRRHTLDESQRWRPERIGPLPARFFEDIGRGKGKVQGSGRPCA